ncbi:FHA domain-containing protein FhaB/FipA [Devriesea agamarum]|uniref:FHA domain-containing protein FhaB/FipA n=1 Tax=Devriesea agamarum TaxID=472569 RepID=UPI00071D8DB2|nr:FHA domain-containing protein [Devriesea agamarum]
MSELTIILLRIGFVVALWLFLFLVLVVLRSDLFGTAVVARGRAANRKNSRRAESRSETSRTDDTPASRTDPSVTARNLVVTAGPLRGTSLHLQSMPVLIGRAPECTLVLDDDYASNRHARVFAKDGEWFVEDLGSTNGTLLAGRRIDSATLFKPGATLRIGRTEIELRRGPR